MKIKDVSIIGYGAYVPIFRIKDSEIARVWGRDPKRVPVNEKSVPGYDEDSLTMAVEATLNALKRSNISPDIIGAILVGSESPPYAVKPSATVIAEVLGVSRIVAVDMEFACRAGTTAMQNVIGMVGSGMIEAGIAIGTDTAQGRPGDELEYTAAAGAASYIISKSGNDDIARFEGSFSYVTDTPDFWRREGERFPRHGYRFTGEPAYFHHIYSAAKGLMDELGLKPQDFAHVVFHQPNVKFPTRMAKQLGFNKEQLKYGLLSGYIGNTYAAASLIGLANVLDNAKVGDRILVVSFGSGAGSDAFSIIVEDGILSKRDLAPKVFDYISRKKYVDYSIYSKFRRNIVM